MEMEKTERTYNGHGISPGARVKIAGIITNSNKDMNQETVIASFAAFTGVLDYYLGETKIHIDFDTSNIDVVPADTDMYFWEACEEDLIFHELDFAVYINGRI